MNSIFDTVADRRNTNSEKWNKIAISSIAANSEAVIFSRISDISVSDIKPVE